MIKNTKPSKALVKTDVSTRFYLHIGANGSYIFKNKKKKDNPYYTATHILKLKPVQKHENILIFGKGKVVYNPQLEEGEPYYRKRKANKGDKPNNDKLGVISESETTNDGFRYPSTVQFFQQKWRR